MLQRAREVRLALVSCGDLGPNSILACSGTVAEHQEALMAAGAVGDLLGTFIDAQGRPVGHELNRRVVALALKDLACVPASILASGGLNKAPVIGAILTAGYVRRLVTDETVAQSLLG